VREREGERGRETNSHIFSPRTTSDDLLHSRSKSSTRKGGLMSPRSKSGVIMRVIY
jgi:hypothetical protein